MTYLLLETQVETIILSRMFSILRVEDRINGADNFKSWKNEILLILEDNDLIRYVKEEI